jgi:hypothetical protein
MLYGVWAVPTVTRATNLETLIKDLKSASSILSALGEHWFEAKRSRDLLDELSQITIRWLFERQASRWMTSAHTVPSVQNISAEAIQPAISLTDNNGNGVQRQIVEEQAGLGSSAPFLDEISSSDSLASVFSFMDGTDSAFDIDSLMQGVFNDYQPDVEFGQSFQPENPATGDVAV